MLAAVLVVTLAMMSFAQLAPAGAEDVVSGRHRLAAVKSWGYQLQRASPLEIAASPLDLVVIDYSRNGTDAGRFTPADVQAMRRKPDGSLRIVLAYLSIGEAEDYRYYWQRNWVEPAPLRTLPDGTSPPAGGPVTVRIPRLIAPGWLGRENERWRGNYHVRFWYDGWQELIMHDQDSYLARIVEAGFDGVYLDRVDVYYAIERDVPGAKHWMINFVEELAMIARKKRPGFIVVPQNAEQLLVEPRYLAAIDGVAKEDLLYGGDGDGVRNGEQRIAFSAGKLARARDAGVTVLAVEYLDDEAAIVAADVELRARGVLPYFGPRRLDRLIVRAVPVSGASGAIETPVGQAVR